MLKNQKSRQVTNFALSQICHYIATHCHKNITTCSNASQLLVTPVKTKHNCCNPKISLKNLPITEITLHDNQNNCTETGSFSSAHPSHSANSGTNC